MSLTSALLHVCKCLNECGMVCGRMFLSRQLSASLVIVLNLCCYCGCVNVEMLIVRRGEWARTNEKTKLM